MHTMCIDSICFLSRDEPKMKATFDVTLIVPKNLTALSNMDVKYTRVIPEMGPDYKAILFKRTPIMPTHVQMKPFIHPKLSE